MEIVMESHEIWRAQNSTNPAKDETNSTIHWTNLYPVDGAIGFSNSYLLDSDLSSRIALSSVWTTRAWVEHLCINIKLKILAWWEYGKLQNASKFTEQTKKSGNIALPQITASYFLKRPLCNGMVQLNHLVFQPEFQVFPM